MSDEPAVPGERAAPAKLDWWCKSSLQLHAVMIVGAGGSLAAGWFEWTRARAGHEIAWVYTFEWPLFAIMGIYLWWQLLHPDRRPSRTRRAPSRPRATDAAVAAADDPELAAWQAYLARLHASDPPGGPPPARGRVT